MTTNEILKVKDLLNRANCIGRECKNCPYYDTNECINKADTHFLRKYVYELKDEINRKNAEIERLQGCVMSEDEVREIMKSQMEDVIKSATEEAMKEKFEETIKMGRKEATLEVLNWLIDLFPEDKYFTTISRFAVKQKYKEMMGDG